MYLEYRTSDGYVVAIHTEAPGKLDARHALAESDMFQPGDEFERYIVVNEVRDGQVVSHAAIRQSPPAQDLLARLAALEKRLEAVETETAVLKSR